MSGFSDGMMNGVSSGGGIGSLFKGLAMADTVRKQAELNAGVKSAQAYQSNMAGNLAGAKNQDQLISNRTRQEAIDELVSNPGLTQFEKNIRTATKFAGGEHAGQFMRGMPDAMQTAVMNEVRDGTIDPTKGSQITFAGSGKAPFSNAKADGYSTNELTGQQIEGNPAVAELYRKLGLSKVSENNAQAGNASASAGQHRAATKKINWSMTPDADGSKPKLGSTDAAEAKARARVVEQVFKDMTVLPEEREAEVGKRMAMGRATPAKPATAGNATQDAESVKAQFKAGKLTREQAKQKLQSLGYN